jgi:hypothetical protein
MLRLLQTSKSYSYRWPHYSDQVVLHSHNLLYPRYRPNLVPSHWCYGVHCPHRPMGCCKNPHWHLQPSRNTLPLTKLNTNKSCYVEKYLALVRMCMLLRNLSIFIQLRSISKSKFSKINTNSDITPPNNLDMVTFEILLTWDVVSS